MGHGITTSWYPSSSRFGLPPRPIHRMTGLGGHFVSAMTYMYSLIKAIPNETSEANSRKNCKSRSRILNIKSISYFIDLGKGCRLLGDNRIFCIQNLMYIFSPWKPVILRRNQLYSKESHWSPAHSINKLTNKETEVEIHILEFGMEIPIKRKSNSSKVLNDRKICVCIKCLFKSGACHKVGQELSWARPYSSCVASKSSQRILKVFNGYVWSGL